jgi:hypothetical protein
MPTPRYDDWSNLWELPTVMISVSLGLGSTIPWTGRHWPWPTWDLFATHFGPLIGGAILLLPFCMWRYRRSDGDWLLRRERMIATATAIIAFVVLLPITHDPRIASQAVVRYALFLVPVVIGWTVAPLVRELSSGPYRHYVPATMLVLLLVFAVQAGLAAVDDAFAPLEYARWCAAHPGSRRIYWKPLRAGSVVDAMAGPRDKVVITGGPDIWIYPAYGAALSRDVAVIKDPRNIPPDAQWIAVDHLPSPFSAPSPEALRFFDAVRRDPRFVVVYRDVRSNQAVFRRVR